MEHFGPRTRLGRIVEGVGTSLATMAVVALLLWFWQSYKHGDVVKWLGGISQPEVERAIKRALDENDELKVQTGVVDINEETHPDLPKPNCRSKSQAPIRYRGARGKRVNFPTPFASAPKVFMALSYIDTATGVEHLRIMTRVTQVDALGFSYDLAVWCNTKLIRGRASWIAVAQ